MSNLKNKGVRICCTGREIIPKAEGVHVFVSEDFWTVPTVTVSDRYSSSRKIGSATKNQCETFFSFFSHFSDSQMVWQSSIWHSGSIPITIINLKIVFSKSLAIYG
jgi:hypothetical protein